ncbi:MAG: hypothetical protein OEZ65_14060, partial [Gemmatimonadota bacterium]|nr:hypothetical protein [Gemmatimonadota bacterium]
NTRMEGATFDLNVQESGLYTAILVFMGRAAPAEIGQLSVSGNVLTMKHQHPDTLTAVSTFTFSGDSLLVLDGNTEFDFNLDGTKEEATLHLELLRK